MRGRPNPIQPRVKTDAPATVRGQRTRESLLEAARVVFTRDGFIDARIADIAAEAGVAHGTFYTYFKSKEEIFREVAVTLQYEMLQHTSSDTTPLAPDDHMGRLRRANRQFLEAYRENAALITVVDQVATFNEETRKIRLEARAEYIRRAKESIRELQRRGLADDRLDPRYVANALGSMVERFAYLWFGLGEPFNMDEAVETLTIIWARAIGLKVD